VRSLIALLASFFGFVHFAAISHMAFVAHARCVEHGQLVHVEAASAAPAAPAVEAPHAAPSAVPGDAHASEDHDHCALGVAPPGEASAGRAAPIVVPDSDAPAVPRLSAPAWAKAPVPPAPPIAILLLSPKSSPPV
jgi:hypothetical protein